MIYRWLRALLFRLDAERAHALTLRALHALLAWRWARSLVRRLCAVRDPRLRQTLWGVTFDNPVGLAAGFDKNAEHVNALGALGFGFIEIGTVTAQSQSGNPTPRLFRLPDDGALLNRMGFNNAGHEAVAARLAAMQVEPVLGVNLGKSKATPLEDAADDYLTSLRALAPHASYVVINVSSPNTPGLRALQAREPLEALMRALRAALDALANERGAPRQPLLLKIAPDLSDEALLEVCEVVRAVGIDGVIATNTTTSREGLNTPQVEALGAGGVSGRPVHARALAVVRLLREALGPQVPIVGVGGIMTPDDALAMILAGASLVQVWTGFVYGGPGLVRDINRRLLAACEARGVAHVRELVGA